MAPAAARRTLFVAILASPVAAFVLSPKTKRCLLRASVDERDASGETPLIKAAEAGDCSAVRDLLKRGADAKAESYTQWTALHGAAENGCVDCIRLLVDAGARPDARAKSGMTPAEIAKKYGRDAAFELLSQTPLDTYPVAVPETGGTIIITPCPGKRKRDLGLDLDQLKSMGAEAIVTMVQDRELDLLSAVWKSNFGRPTPSTRRRPRSCVCAMAWRFHAIDAMLRPFLPRLDGVEVHET